MSLTVVGRKLALHIIRRYRPMETLLVETLGFDGTEMHEEAVQIEIASGKPLLDELPCGVDLGAPLEFNKCQGQADIVDRA